MIRGIVFQAFNLHKNVKLSFCSFLSWGGGGEHCFWDLFAGFLLLFLLRIPSCGLRVLSRLPLLARTNGAAPNILFKSDDLFHGEKNLRWKTGTAFSPKTGQSWTHLRNSHTKFTFKTSIMKTDLSLGLFRPCCGPWLTHTLSLFFSSPDWNRPLWLVDLIPLVARKGGGRGIKGKESPFFLKSLEKTLDEAATSALSRKGPPPCWMQCQLHGGQGGEEIMSQRGRRLGEEKAKRFQETLAEEARVESWKMVSRVWVLLKIQHKPVQELSPKLVCVCVCMCTGAGSLSSL